MSLIAHLRQGILFFGLANLLSVLTAVLVMGAVGPTGYGVIAWAWMLMHLLLLLGEMGLGTALIQSPGLDGSQKNAAFWLTGWMGLAICLFLFAFAPAFERLTDAPGLAGYVRIMSLAAILVCASIVPRSLLQRELRFSRVAGAESASAVVHLVVTLALLYSGVGVRSVAIGFLTSQAVSAWMLWGAEPWRPSYSAPLRLKPAGGLVRYGRWVLGSSVINFLAGNADSASVGKFLGTASLGIYNAGYQAVLIPVTRIAHLVLKVLFPALSRVQEEDALVRAAYVRTIRLIALVTFPLTLGAAAVASPAVDWILDASWRPVLPVLWILAPLGGLKSISSAIGTVFHVKGNPRILFVMSCINTTLILIVAPLATRAGVTGVAAAVAAITVVLFIPFQHMTNKALGIGWGRFFVALAPAIVSSAVMLLAVAGTLILTRTLPAAGQVLLAVPAGATVYCLMIYLAFRSTFADAWHVLRSRASQP